MNKAKHNRKKKMARKMMSQAMITSHRPIFDNSNWVERKEAIADRIRRKVAAIRLKKEKLASA